MTRVISKWGQEELKTGGDPTMENQTVVPLATAAFQLGMPYRRAYERLLAGTLRGVRKDGKWFVLES